MVRVDTCNSFRMGNLNDEKTMERFVRLYKRTPQEFMDYHGSNIEIDIKGKIVVITEGGDCCDNTNFPITLSNIYIPEECNATAKLIYSGHIAFLIYTSMSGKECILYKDDECPPQTIQELCDPWKGEESEAEYEAKERGFKVEDILTQIELTMRAMYDFNYKLTNTKDVIVLQGL